MSVLLLVCSVPWGGSLEASQVANVVSELGRITIVQVCYSIWPHSTLIPHLSSVPAPLCAPPPLLPHGFDLACDPNSSLLEQPADRVSGASVVFAAQLSSTPVSVVRQGCVARHSVALALLSNGHQRTPSGTHADINAHTLTHPYRHQHTDTRILANTQTQQDLYPYTRANT